ncbi:MAG TPA: trehalose-phosphatase [Actinomycetota bacterium]|nr:trehalose-phosphatase [Actinomycetota bacterium]
MNALDELRRRAAEAAVITDFDGTLSPIAPTPEAALALDGVPDALEDLATGYALVAVLSGRRAAEVAALLGRPRGVRVVGLYGLEDGDGPTDTPEHPHVVDGVLADLERVAARVPGARIERKGANVAVHYRGAPDPARARQMLLAELDAVATAGGLRVLEGKKVVELAPAGGPTKGDALRHLMGQHPLRAVLYAGDDVADLDAFDAVTDLRDHGMVGVTVAVRSAETPASLIDRATVVVEGPEGMLDVLRGLRPD